MTSTASLTTPEKSLISIAPMIGCLQISPRKIWRSPSAICSAQHRPRRVAGLHLFSLPWTVASHDVAPPWSSFSNAAWISVQTGLDPLHMTARVQETLIAVTIASVDVHTNATISESPIATPLHTGGGPVLGSRLLPDIWTSPASPLVISEARRLTADPVAYAEARRLTAHPVAYSEVRRITAVTVASSGGRRLKAVPVACSEALPVAYSEARRLTAVPVAYSEARRLTAVPVAYSKARRLQGVTNN